MGSTADHREAILDPALPIVDPHHHPWDRPRAVIAARATSKHDFTRMIERAPRHLLGELMADLDSDHDIGTLAQSPKVAVKLGGLAMAFQAFDSFPADPPTPSSRLAAERKPYIEICIDTFGPDRCMFESNFSADIGRCEYDVPWNAFKTIAAGCSAEEKAALFSGAATRICRLTH
jgi:predicted TIM-barrel fold metal-dependent hydrolase